MLSRGDKMRKNLFFLETTDVRDGLFPSLRHALAQLKTMNDENGGKYRNSARVIKKIKSTFKVKPEELYDALINLTYPRCEIDLVDGHGILGFPPANMHFTEMRVSNFYRQIISNYNTTDYNKPLYLPLPLILSNGTVSSKNHKTFIPSHNIGEVIDATIALIQNPDIETKDLLKYIKGPDIIVGGEITNSEQLPSIYEKGRGVIEIKITPQTISDEFYGNVSEFCKWYNMKLRKYSSKKEQKILIKYKAKLFDGKTVKYMSLKEILQNYIEHCKTIETGISDDILCQKLEKVKTIAIKRKTKVYN